LVGHRLLLFRPVTNVCERGGVGLARLADAIADVALESLLRCHRPLHA
jgi:hypothetical protein